MVFVLVLLTFLAIDGSPSLLVIATIGDKEKEAHKKTWAARLSQDTVPVSHIILETEKGIKTR